MNIFVLCTGRCGSVTFARACSHLSNYTAGHESNARRAGPERLDYPGDHIEVDNRLSWFLGRLGARYNDLPVRYVHLRRDPEKVARSLLQRWDSKFRGSIVRAYSHGIISRPKEWPEEQRLEVCRDYVETVTANIEEFLRDRPAMTLWVEEAESVFPDFLDWIGAEGDLDAALSEWQTVHNASPQPSESGV